MMMFAILFGLSMDYEVFLLSRIRENYVRGASNSEAVARGVGQTARVITAAAAIMISVFLSFALLGDDRIIKAFGLGLATAIFVDATIVRLVLVPATMQLLGDANWWFPRWLDRLLPRLAIEGPRERRTTGERPAARAVQPSAAELDQLMARRLAGVEPGPAAALPVDLASSEEVPAEPLVPLEVIASLALDDLAARAIEVVDHHPAEALADPWTDGAPLPRSMPLEALSWGEPPPTRPEPATVSGQRPPPRDYMNPRPTAEPGFGGGG
jgi:hypothetical protein